MESTLSEQRSKLKRAEMPLPIYSCIHVKHNVTAKQFQGTLSSCTCGNGMDTSC